MKKIIYTSGRDFKEFRLFWWPEKRLLHFVKKKKRILAWIELIYSKQRRFKLFKSVLIRNAWKYQKSIF